MSKNSVSGNCSSQKARLLKLLVAILSSAKFLFFEEDFLTKTS
jgi:hypothetical protein